MDKAIPVKSLAKHPYITQNRRICGGSPVIKGTRVRVIDVAIEYEKLGYTPDQIVDAHPHLTLPQVHDALSFYYENQEELDERIASGDALIAELKKRYPSKIRALYGQD